MIEYENAEVPFKQMGNKQILDDYTIAENPWLWDFIKLFSHCFERSEQMRCYVFYPEGVPQMRCETCHGSGWIDTDNSDGECVTPCNMCGGFGVVNCCEGDREQPERDGLYPK